MARRRVGAEGDLDGCVKKPTDIWAGAGPQWILPDQVDWRREFLKRRYIVFASLENGFFRPPYLRNAAKSADGEAVISTSGRARNRRRSRRLSWYPALAEATTRPPLQWSSLLARIRKSNARVSLTSSSAILRTITPHRSAACTLAPRKQTGSVH